MLYSQILNPYPNFTEEKAKKAADLLNEVLEGRNQSHKLNSYDSVLLQAAKEVMERGLKYEFDEDFIGTDFDNSEYLKVLYRWLETIAFYDNDGMWFLKNLSECSHEDIERDYFRDDFAITNFGFRVSWLLTIGGYTSPI